MLSFFSSKKDTKKSAKNPKFITNSDEIYKMLKHICVDQLPLIISGENTDQEETTYILKAGTELFIIDRLEDNSSHEKLLSSPNIKARANVDGVNITFNITLENSSPQANSNYYRAVLPQEIYNPQRRNNFRALIPSDIKIPFNARYGPDETQITGEIIDLSAEGAGIILDGRIFARKGEKIRACTFQMPKGITVTADIEIRTTRPCVRDDRMMRIGVRFASPNRKTQKQIRKTVLLLEEIQRRQKKNKNS